MPIAPDIVAGVARRLAEHAGLELPTWVVEARAASRIGALGIAPQQYLELIGSVRGAAELDELIEAVRVGESRLFRHRSQIAALVDAVVPVLRAKNRKAIRVWSAGCAAGEEPYTLAAVLAAALPDVALTIVATDVSADALELAQRATYPASAWQDIPEDWRDSFTFDGTAVRVRPEIASIVRFERANLADALGGSTPRGCELVWCRNVLIYFTPAARKRVVDRLVGALRPGGFLFVGYSESLRDIAELEPMRASSAGGDAVYYCKRAADTGEHPTVPLRPTPVPAFVAPRASEPTGPIAARPAPPPTLPPPMPTPHEQPEHVVALTGHPSARSVTQLLTSTLGTHGLRRLVIDLDGADLIGDELAPVLRRARAAAMAAGVALEVRATRTGARRWLSRHDLDEGGP
ncbi:MAG TPA: CheR family methyltransferase [Kofleriaceae bacterium]|nr:CheR family methyltransferase [Kofleriaceae bacterium]